MIQDLLLAPGSDDVEGAVVSGSLLLDLCSTV